MEWFINGHGKKTFQLFSKMQKSGQKVGDAWIKNINMLNKNQKQL